MSDLSNIIQRGGRGRSFFWRRRRRRRSKFLWQYFIKELTSVPPTGEEVILAKSRRVEDNKWFAEQNMRWLVWLLFCCGRSIVLSTELPVCVRRVRSVPRGPSHVNSPLDGWTGAAIMMDNPSITSHDSWDCEGTRAPAHQRGLYSSTWTYAARFSFPLNFFHQFVYLFVMTLQIVI